MQKRIVTGYEAIRKNVTLVSTIWFHGELRCSHLRNLLGTNFTNQNCNIIKPNNQNVFKK